MYAVANIDKFMDDHPEIKKFQGPSRMEILSKAYEAADERGVLASGSVKEILGEHAGQFFTEAENSLEHMQIGLQAFRAMDLNKSLLIKKE